MLTRKWSLTILLVCLLVFCSRGCCHGEVRDLLDCTPLQEVFWHEMAKAVHGGESEYNIQILPMAERNSEETILTAIPAGQLQPPRRTSSSDSALNWCRPGPRSSRHHAGLGQADRCSQDGRSYQRMGVPDGHYYILPIYCNPILYGWRTDILAELGV